MSHRESSFWLLSIVPVSAAVNSNRSSSSRLLLHPDNGGGKATTHSLQTLCWLTVILQTRTKTPNIIKNEEYRGCTSVWKS